MLSNTCTYTITEHRQIHGEIDTCGQPTVARELWTSLRLEAHSDAREASSIVDQVTSLTGSPTPRALATRATALADAPCWDRWTSRSSALRAAWFLVTGA